MDKIFPPWAIATLCNAMCDAAASYLSTRRYGGAFVLLGRHLPNGYALLSRDYLNCDGPVHPERLLGGGQPGLTSGPMANTADFRLYRAKDEIVNGVWVPPPFAEINED